MASEQPAERAFCGLSAVTFPLHPEVESEERVARLVRRFPGLVEAEGTSLARTDVLQALAITTALRLSVASANRKPGLDLAIELIDVSADPLTRAALEPGSSNSPRVRLRDARMPVSAGPLTCNG